jgi:hypothetical protein
MTERVSTVADWGVSRSGVSVFVAVLDAVAAYPALRARSATTRIRANSGARVPGASESAGRAESGAVLPCSCDSAREVTDVRTARERRATANVRRIGSIFVWITDMTFGETAF